VTNYTRLASQQAAEEDAKARRVAAAKAQMFKDPGVVGVQIIAAPKKPEQPQ